MDFELVLKALEWIKMILTEIAKTIFSVKDEGEAQWEESPYAD